MTDRFKVNWQYDRIITLTNLCQYSSSIDAILNIITDENSNKESDMDCRSNSELLLREELDLSLVTR